MIMNDDDTTLSDVLTALSTAPHTFHLTGRRFFDPLTVVQGWEFFAEDSEEIREFLEEKGFSLTTTVRSAQSHRTQRLRDDIVYRHNHGVSVTLVSNTEMHRTIQKAIKRVYGDEIPEDNTTFRMIWTLACAAYQAGFDSHTLNSTTDSQ